MARRIGGPATTRALALAALALAALACSSRTFHRESDTSGTFRIEATSCRFLAFFEAPFDPRLKAMELARDTWGENLRVTRTYSWPNWGFLSFLNGLIIGFRGTIVEGEYGVPPDTPEGRSLYDALVRKRVNRDIDGSALTPSEGEAPQE